VNERDTRGSANGEQRYGNHSNGFDNKPHMSNLTTPLPALLRRYSLYEGMGNPTALYVHILR
jgi:hypothetical protein